VEKLKQKPPMSTFNDGIIALLLLPTLPYVMCHLAIGCLDVAGFGQHI